jgi:peptidase S24-like protein
MSVLTRPTSVLLPDAGSLPARVLTPVRLLEVVRGVTEAGGNVWVRVTGISMNPILREGDSVLLGGFARPPQRGDVVLISVAGAPVLHRVVLRDALRVVTRGDAARADDLPVPHSACVGHALLARRESYLVALTPTLRFGVRPFLWFLAWRLRARVPSWLLRRASPVTHAIVRAIS